VTGLHNPDVTYDVPSVVQDMLRTAELGPVSLGKEAVEGIHPKHSVPAATSCIETEVPITVESLSPPKVDMASLLGAGRIPSSPPGSTALGTRGNPVSDPRMLLPEKLTPERGTATAARRSRPKSAMHISRYDGDVDESRTVIPRDGTLAIRRKSRSPKRRHHTTESKDGKDIASGMRYAEQVLSEKLAKCEELETWMQERHKAEHDACQNFSQNFHVQARLYEEAARDQHERLEGTMKAEHAAQQADLVSQNVRLRGGLQQQADQVHMMRVEGKTIVEQSQQQIGKRDQVIQDLNQ